MWQLHRACSGAEPQRPEAFTAPQDDGTTAPRLRGASRAPARSMTTTKTVDDAAMRERERCWAAWANADTLHLCVGSVPSGLRLFDGVGGIAIAHAHPRRNYMRNSLLATSVGLTMIHFRREIEERPPLGGLVMTALGLGYAFAGGACHLYAVARLRSSLLSPLGTFAACAHAVAPPFMLSTAALCFLDRSPPVHKPNTHEDFTRLTDWFARVSPTGQGRRSRQPATGLWRTPADGGRERQRWYSHFQSEKKLRPPSA